MDNYYYGAVMSVQELKQKLQIVFQSAEEGLKSAQNSSALYELKTRFMGSKSEFQKIIKEMKNLSPEEKPSFGKWLNERKKTLENMYAVFLNSLKRASFSKK